MPKDPNGVSTQGASDSQGTGYIPPRSAVALTGASAATGGAAAGVVGLMVPVAFLFQAAARGQEAGVEGVPQNLPLAAGLLLAAVVFAGLALLVTALAGREVGYRVETPKELLWTYSSLTLLGLAVDGFALERLAQGAVDSFWPLALTGTLLELLAFAAGIYSLLPVLKRRFARNPQEATSDSASRAAQGTGS
jgi:hypothetical protein